MNNWISVKDRLPEFEKDVLVSYSHESSSWMCVACVSSIVKSSIGETASWDDHISGGTFTNVTHWQPLPEPPQQ